MYSNPKNYVQQVINRSKMQETIYTASDWHEFGNPNEHENKSFENTIAFGEELEFPNESRDSSSKGRE